MPVDRGEPFQIALISLRERLREGILPPGERIAAVDIAADLRLSATPVREALWRLVGEGLLEDRRGQGFFVRPLTATDITDLYGLSLAHLDIAHEPERTPVRRLPAPMPGIDVKMTDPVRDVERLFAGWISETGSPALIAAHRAILIQLGPVRRVEPKLFEDLATEASKLRVLDPREPGGEWSAAVREFHERRIAQADRLAGLLGWSDEAKI
jgi:hypothetical protein